LIGIFTKKQFCSNGQFFIFPLHYCIFKVNNKKSTSKNLTGSPFVAGNNWHEGCILFSRQQGGAPMDKMQLLYIISQVLDEEDVFGDGIGSALCLAAEELQFQRSMLTILDETNERTVIEKSTGLTPEQAELGAYHNGEGIVGTVLTTGERVVIPKISDNPTFLDRTGARKGLDTTELAFI
jgi:hypothetical protein